MYVSFLVVIVDVVVVIMDWTLMVTVLALWDIVRTLAVVLFTAWYTARKVRQNGEEKSQ